jgi:hypothetical protein
MSFVVTVVLVFDRAQAEDKRYDVWDVQTPVEADSPRKALEGAISLSKNPEDWKRLGYPDGPVLVGIRSVDTVSDMFPTSQKISHRGRLPVLVGGVDEHNFHLLRSFNEISFPYSLMYIDGAFPIS